MESVKYRHYELIDVHSWNYGRRYLPARMADPSKAVIISESASTISTRGYYSFPLPKNKTDFYIKDFQISSYDMNAPEWAEPADLDFMWQEQDKFVAGEFVWTGFDYLGEPTPYNYDFIGKGLITREQAAKSSYFGIVDLCGIPKDRFYLYKSYWMPDVTTIHVLPHWNWKEKEGENVPVFVYTNGDVAELFLNGKSLGKREKQPESQNYFERYRLMWNDVLYEPGVLKVIVFKEGKILGEKVIRTAGEPSYLKLTPDRTSLKSNGEDLSYILVEAFDIEGNLCPLADNLLKFELKGPAEIAGVGNGNPQSIEPFNSDQRKLFYGKAMLIIRTQKNAAGDITVSVSSEGLKGASFVCKSVK
jgi:beta-galactosidase